MNNRLLFAAARGARIESYDVESREWHEARLLPIKHASLWEERRIYEVDEYLQYGPISRALRNRVMVGPFKEKDFDLAWQYFKARFNDWYKIPDEDLLMTLLIMAEFLADEGM